MIGRILNNRYEIRSKIGTGGMAVVYEGHDLMLDRMVAIKVLSETRLGEDGEQRLMREAKAAANLNHPHIVSIFDVGIDDDVLFVVMEFMQGKTLRGYLHVPMTETLEIFQQICQALEHAHNHGIIHRDLKPENILIMQNQRAKLMDFGLALPAGGTRLTVEGTIVGTFAYLAPELVMGQEASPQSDLYALGVMLYEQVTGRPPFQAENMLAVISQHINAPVRPPSMYNKEISQELDSLVIKLLAKRPQERHESAMVVYEELQSIAAALNAGENLHSSQQETSQPVGGSLALLDKMVRGQLIGRAEELAELKEFWMRAENGQGHLVLISGEPGAGKTRLADELAVFTHLRGAKVIKGHFHQELGVTYLGIRESLQNFLRSMTIEDAKEAIGSSAAEMVKLVPDIVKIVGMITPNPPMGELEAERLRMFDHISQFIIRQTQQTPVLLILEDLHWADNSSLLFLHYLLRNTRKERILVVGTYREVSLDPSRPFYESLLGLNRERLYTRIALRNLEPECIHRLVNVLLDGPVDEELLSNIEQDTEGNPFFIEEVVKGWIERSALVQVDGNWRLRDEIQRDIPQSIQIALGRRLEVLSPDARAALTLASILGHIFDFDVLLRMSDWDEDHLLDLLDDAERAQLITEAPEIGTDSYRFGHALLAQILYDNLNARRRSRLHLRAAEILEALHDKRLDDYIESLAYHYSLSPAASGVKMVTYGLKAAEKAAAVYAHTQALRYYTEVLEAMEDLQDFMGESQVWEMVGDTNLRLYFVSKAIDAYEQSLAALERLGDGEDEIFCRIPYKLGELYVRENRDAKRAREYLEHALRSQVSPANSLQRVKCISTLAICNLEEGNVEQALEQAASALQMAEDLGISDGIASACGALCKIHNAQGDFTSFSQVSERQVQALGEYQDLYGIFDTYHNIIAASWEKGDYESAERYAQSGIELCRKFNAPGWEGVILANYMWLLNKGGRWDEALDYGDKVLPLFDRVGCSTCFTWIFWHLGEIEAKLGNLEQAKEYFESANNIIIQINLLTRLVYWRILKHVAFEEWEQAWETVEEWRSMEDTDPGFGLIVVIWNALVPLVAAHVGRYDEAKQLAAKMLELLQAGGGRPLIGYLYFALGLAHAGERDWERAIEYYLLAMDEQQQYSPAWDMGNTCYYMAQAYLSRGENTDQKLAVEYFHQALSKFKALNAQPAVERTQAAINHLTTRVKTI